MTSPLCTQNYFMINSKIIFLKSLSLVSLLKDSKKDSLNLEKSGRSHWIRAKTLFGRKLELNFTFGF